MSGETKVAGVITGASRGTWAQPWSRRIATATTW